MEQADTDVLIVGAGIAALATALSVANRRVTLLCPALPPQATSSSFAQGGIAAAVDEDDSTELHALDTLQAGAGLCDADRVRLLCDAAPDAIRWLEDSGARFDRMRDTWTLHREGGHRRARVLHIDGDRTGHGLTAKLFDAVRAMPNIEFCTGRTALSLLRGNDGIAGVVACDQRSRPSAIRARDTVIATGGLGQMFEHTTNPRSACGDGLAMALIAGASCARLEFVQFHPTAFSTNRDPLPLISEALRGAGATLVDEDGKRFMTGIHPDAELAPRDIVARTVWRYVQAGCCVYLDTRAVFQCDPTSFPALRKLCTEHHLDPLHELIPVLPAAHYHMGGIAVTEDGRTSLAHLWACGEAASTNIHGANRLASNSLLEAVVFGRRLGAALTAQRERVSVAHRWWRAGSVESTAEIDMHVWTALRQVMWNSLGIERDATTLMDGRERLALMLRQTSLHQTRMRSRIRLGIAMLSAALARTESIGAHCRVDAVVSAGVARQRVREPRTYDDDIEIFNGVRARR